MIPHKESLKTCTSDTVYRVSRLPYPFRKPAISE